MTIARTIAAIAAGLICGLAPVFAQDRFSDEDFEIRHPFASETARRNFQQCFEEAKNVDSFSRITYWGYRFSPHVGCPPTNLRCEPSTKFFRLRRTITISASEANPSNVFATLRSALERQSCTSPREIGNFSPQITNKSARYGFHVRERKRICPFWGGSTTVGEGTVDVVTGYNLSSDFNLSPFRQISNERGEILGIFRGGLAESLVMVALGGFGALLPILAIEIARDEMIGKLRSNDFLGAGIDLTRFIARNPLHDIGSAGHYSVDFVTQMEESGFRQDGDQVSIQILQDGYRASYLEPEIKRVRKLEIDFLKSLSEVGPEEYVVAKGDNLWKIAAKKFGDPRLFLLIKQLNGKSDAGLRVGEVLKLPRWYELCKQLKPGSLLVKQGESIWGKAQAKQLEFDLKRVKTESGDPDLIFPFERLKIIERKRIRSTGQ